jgi:predicted RNA-binding protein with RPS1 domain
VENTDENVTTSLNDITGDGEGPKKSFWMPKGKKSWWVEKKNLNDLNVGDELYGHVVEELINGKTGPKLYFDCGVGRTDKKGNWHIVNGMMRLDRSKASVARKRAARFRSKDRVPLYVSRIQKECGRLEVCATPEEAEKYSQDKPKIPVTSLQSGQEVKGTIYKLLPYGAIVDVEANRRGLLHITKVASLYGRYIDKEKGLVQAGIERGARVRLMVESVNDKRLFLDFTPDVKEEAERELKQSSTPASNNKDDESLSSSSSVVLQDWAEYANQQTSSEIETQKNSANDDNDEYDVDEELDDDEYDEDSDIEEALGLDTY